MVHIRILLSQVPNPVLTRLKSKAIVAVTGMFVQFCPRNTIQHFNTNLCESEKSILHQDKQNLIPKAILQLPIE